MRVDGPGTAVGFSTLKGGLQGYQAEANEAVDKTGKEEQVTQQDKLPVNHEQLKAAVEIANSGIKICNYNLEFRIHKESGRVQVKVIDTQSGEVIREIPPEQMLRLSASIKEMLEKFQKMVGILVDEFV